MCERSPRVRGHPLGRLRGGHDIVDHDGGEANLGGQGVEGVDRSVREREELV